MSDSFYKRMKWLLFGEYVPEDRTVMLREIFPKPTGGTLSPEELEAELKRVTAMLHETNRQPKVSIAAYLAENQVEILAGAHDRKRFTLIETEEKNTWAPAGKVTVVIGGSIYEIDGPEMTPGEFRDLLVKAQVGDFVMDPLNARKRAEFLNTREARRQQALLFDESTGPAAVWAEGARREEPVGEGLPVEHEGLTEDEERIVEDLRARGYTEEQLREVIRTFKHNEKAGE